MPAALDGMRILDMTQWEAGTSCTQALAWLGADVVKIEPRRGDPGRGISTGSDHSGYFLNWNSNKRSVVIDLGRPEGRALLLRLVPNFDVFVENYGPGVVEKLDIDYPAMRDVHPDLIYARVKGFGTSGPYADYKCMDMVAQAAAGSMSVTGEADGPPLRPGATIADSGTGMQLAVAILAAYIQRERDGMGQLIEISMQEAMTYYMRTVVGNGADFGERAATRSGNGTSPMLNLYPCKGDGPNDYIYLMIVNTRMWQNLCRAIDREDLLTDPRFERGRGREQNRDVLRAELSNWTHQRDKYEAMHVIASSGVPCGAVLDTRDLFHDPHLLERGFVHTVEHEVLGPVKLLGWPARMANSEVPIEAAPLLGQHTNEVLTRELGVSESELSALRDNDVIA